MIHATQKNRPCASLAVEPPTLLSGNPKINPATRGAAITITSSCRGGNRRGVREREVQRKWAHRVHVAHEPVDQGPPAPAADHGHGDQQQARRGANPAADQEGGEAAARSEAVPDGGGPQSQQRRLQEARQLLAQQRQRAGAVREAELAQQHGTATTDRLEERVRGPATAGAGSEQARAGGQGGHSAGGRLVLRPPQRAFGPDGQAGGRPEEAPRAAPGEGVAAAAQPGVEASISGSSM